MKNLLVISCSPRERSNSLKIANFIKDNLNKMKVSCDVLELSTYHDKTQKTEILKKIKGATLILWVSPEYNRSYTSLMKLIIEDLGVENMQQKLNAIVSVSSGISSRAGLNQTAALLFSVDSIVITPGIECNKQFLDNPTFEYISPVIRNLFFWGEKIL